MPLTPQQQKRLDELRAKKAASAGKETPLQFIGRAVTEPAQQVFSPVGNAFERIDTVTGAPSRAALGEYTSGGTAAEALKKGIAQAKAGLTRGELLPSTPSGEELTYTALTKSAGISPEYASPMSEAFGPIAASAIDLSNLVPLGAGTKAVRAAGSVPGKVIGAVTKTARAMEPAGNLVAEKFMQVGKTVTEGKLKPPAAMRATKNITAMEQIFPGKSAKQAQEQLKAIRNLAAQNKSPLPTGDETLSAVYRELKEAKERVATAPQANAVIKKVEKLARKQDGISVFELDDLQEDLNKVKYTNIGNERSIDKRLLPYQARAQKAVEQGIESDPTGVGPMLNSAKARSHALLTVKESPGKFSFNPVELLKNPRNYHRLVGAARLPKQAVESINAAYNTGDVLKLRTAIDDFAKRNPKRIDALMRQGILIPGKIEPEFESNETIVVPRRGSSYSIKEVLKAGD